MAAFIRKLARFLGSTRGQPEVYLAAFGKHPGWDDHTDDLGLDTDVLVSAKRLIYIQGIAQNIDSGTWESLDPETTYGSTDAPAGGRLDAFGHDFLWHASDAILLAGRLWSSVDGKGRDKYPMVLTAQLNELSIQFATEIVIPFLTHVHARCAAADSADAVRRLIDIERETLRAKVLEVPPTPPLTADELLAVVSHPTLNPRGPNTAGEGFYRIIYQFAGGMSAWRSPPPKNAQPRRSEQVRLPTCGMAPKDALNFWLRFALTFLDPTSPILLIAPDQGPKAPWVDLIVGEPAPANLFCIKAGTNALPMTSDIPYTIDSTLKRTVDGYLASIAGQPNLPLPPWPL